MTLRLAKRWGPMPTEYVDEALRRARYELIDDEATPYYGEVPELPGVWACGATLEDCRRQLKKRSLKAGS